MYQHWLKESREASLNMLPRCFSLYNIEVWSQRNLQLSSRLIALLNSYDHNLLSIVVHTNMIPFANTAKLTQYWINIAMQYNVYNSNKQLRLRRVLARNIPPPRRRWAARKQQWLGSSSSKASSRWREHRCWTPQWWYLCMNGISEFDSILCIFIHYFWVSSLDCINA